MNDTEKYILNSIRYWTWSGFYQEDQAQEMLEDILEEDVDEDAMRAAISAEFDKKAAAEEGWPDVTDCDRLDVVFKTLDEDGICAVQNAGYTMSDGYGEVAEAVHERGLEHYHGYCFFHGQDIERAIDGQGLMLAFGNLDDNDAKAVRAGQAIVAELRKAGFETRWDGTTKQRIEIPKIDWKRRY